MQEVRGGSQGWFLPSGPGVAEQGHQMGLRMGVSMKRPTCLAFGCRSPQVLWEGRGGAVAACSLLNIVAVRRLGRVPCLVDQIRVPIAPFQVDPPEMDHPSCEY